MPPLSPAMTAISQASASTSTAGTKVQSEFVQRRKFWRMRCANNGVQLKTTAIDTQFGLKIPANTVEHTDNSIDYSGNVNLEETEELLSQDIERSSQLANGSSLSQSALGAVTYRSKALQSVLGESKIQLSGEQKAVLNLVTHSNQNIFFTGAAGTGKSVLLRCMIALLKEKYGSSNVHVTALTGIAACNIGGCTLHRWAGIGLGNDSVDNLVTSILKQKRNRERWRKTRVLLIDEISMLSAPLLMKLEKIGQRVRNNSAPFGGIQLICTGDMFQLPPIDNSDPRFCFETEVWNRLIHRTINLTQVFRQKNPQFANVLNEIRTGVVSPEASELMASLRRPPKIPKGLVPTSLFPTRDEVSRANSLALSKIRGTTYVYESEDWVAKNAGGVGQMDKLTTAEREIGLKVGAQVMLIKNIDDTLVNGSIGRVVGFMSENMTMAEDGDAVYHEDSAYDRKVKKILGVNGEAGKFDLSSSSSQRKRMLADRISNEAAKKTAVLPVVKFVAPNNTSRDFIVHPETWEITDSEGEIIASRTQIPLILAWALSVHKAQGQTLPHVSVNLAQVFAKGQAYVAISRATCLEGLQVLNFTPNKIQASNIVLRFYKSLSKLSAEEIASAEADFEKIHVLTSSTTPKNSPSKESTLEEETLVENVTADARINKSHVASPFSKHEAELKHEDSVIDEKNDLKTSFISMSSQPPCVTSPQHLRTTNISAFGGDSNENMFSDFHSDDIDYVKKAIFKADSIPRSDMPDMPLKRMKREMIYSSSQ